MQTVNEYLETVSQEQLTEYIRIKKIVFEIVSDASETIAYGIPTFKYKGKNLLHFGAFKDHVSIFPGSHAIEILKNDLSDYKIARGTIQYTEHHLIPEALIIKILTIGIADIDAAT